MQETKEFQENSPPLHKRLVKFFENYPEIDSSPILTALGKFAYESVSEAFRLIPSYRKWKDVTIMVYENFWKKLIHNQLAKDARHTKTFTFTYSVNSSTPCYDIVTVQDIQEKNTTIAELNILSKEISQ